jgi:hypothetical protein
MSRLKLTDELVEAAVLGGCVLGGGGGGSMEEGRRIGHLAVSLSSPELIDVEDINENFVFINVSAVGAPSAKDAYAEPIHYLRAAELVEKVASIKIDGIITNEAGGLATVNGWLQASMLGIPVVDAPCNGRAHPTGIMGSMGLHRDKNYLSIQAGVGGSKERSTFLEVVAIGSIESASTIIRNAAVRAGGLVAVARNPVTLYYAKENAALGAVKQAINLGFEMIKSREKGSKAIIDSVCNYLNGEIVTYSSVERIDLETRGGFDVGRILLERGFEITFWNEYMTLEKTGERLATFPDLIMTIDGHTGLPVTSAEIKAGEHVAVVKVSKENLKLGSGMKDADLFKACEEIIGKKIIEFIF